MASVVLFHSVMGLRPVELDFAASLRDAGHEVRVPDLFDGQRSDDINDGFAIKARVGWDLICARARHGVQGLPKNTVLAGISMGAGVVSELWPDRPETEKVLLIHGLANVPSTARSGTPVQLHVSQEDHLFPPAAVRGWEEAARQAALAFKTFTYTPAGHFFLDRSSADYSAAAASALTARVLTFLASV